MTVRIRRQETSGPGTDRRLAHFQGLQVGGDADQARFDRQVIEHT